MLDFVKIEKIETKKSTVIYPEFVVVNSKDLMIRGKAFYAIWDEQAGFWSKSEMDVQRIIDNEVFQYAKDNDLLGIAKLKLLKDFSSNKWTEWQKYCKSLADNYHELDEKIVFSNSVIKKKDFVTRTLPYPLEDIDTPAYNELMDTLYAEKEREKIEWGIGSIISGDSKSLQKFFVFYGGPGTGKSTILNIISILFDGYCGIFDAKAISSTNNSFSLDAFRNNPLVGIQHDGDLSRIEDNTKLNSIVSHEKLIINEKFKAPYPMKIKTMLFMGTNKPVKITDSKSGILRRLINITPTGNKLSPARYEQIMSQIQFELGGIANHCLNVYKDLGKKYYETYIPTEMLEVTNDFYIFIEDNYDLFAYAENDEVTLNSAWRAYKIYVDQANVKYPMTMRSFKTELMDYYENFYKRYNGMYSVFKGFLKDKIGYEMSSAKDQEQHEYESWLRFEKQESEFDLRFSDCLAQYANEKGIPVSKWDKTVTTLSGIDTSKVHYVKVPSSLIVIDFDLKDGDKKSFEKNLEAANKWPQTYAELSKSEAGIHLHYWYDGGDITEISRVVDDGIEIKIFNGNSALRRKLTKCNDLPIAHIASGLPLKERGNKYMVTDVTLKSERSLRNLIERNLRKEIHPGTKPSMDFIYKILDEAYESGMHYDVRDMRPVIQNFAMNSTHQADYCLRLLSKMNFASEEPSENEVSAKGEGNPIVFFDVEVFPNLFVVSLKKIGKGEPFINFINPTPQDIEGIIKFRLVGYNNRKYDNHILYAKLMGYNEEQLYKLSQRIINDDRSALFGEAYNLSYTDIYDFLSAQNKKSLKRWEIELGIHHQELGLPWDQPVAEELWPKVVVYCNYDVEAAEAVWNANQSDWLARVILADLAGMTVNDTTNQLTTRIIVGKDRNPQDQYIYTDLSEMFPGYEYNPYGIPAERYNEGTKLINQKSIYRGEDPGEGGYVYAEPGIYVNVALLDVASMHPSSLIAMNMFGDQYTKRFADLKEARVLIKHKEFEKAGEIMDGMLKEHLKDAAKAAGLPNALKTAINSVYGLTSAKFPNKLKDPRNVDNIVAKRGGLFMINLKHEVQERGYTVVHIKTDSIKIADADESIIQFVTEYGKKYGYDFEHEATYDRICLVNDAVYVAKVSGGENGVKLEVPYWTATGTQFQIPYVFKTLFSKEPITLEDMTETKSVSTALYLDMNEDLSDMPFDEFGNATPDDHPSRHDYRFVGKVGAFCPMKDGSGGGLLLREIAKDKQKGNRFASANGASSKTGKLYRWMEAEMVKKLGLEDQVDRTYYNALVDDAIETIDKYGDFERFVSDDPYPDENWMKIPDGVDEEMPFPMNSPE